MISCPCSSFNQCHTPSVSVCLRYSSTSASQSWQVWASRVSLWFLHHIYLTCFLCWCLLLLSCTSLEHFYISTLFSSAGHLAERARRRRTEWCQRGVIHTVCSECAWRLSLVPSCPKCKKNKCTTATMNWWKENESATILKKNSWFSKSFLVMVPAA